MIPNLNIILDIQKRSGSLGNKAFLSVMDRDDKGEGGKFQDHPYVARAPDLLMPIADQRHQTDLFFTPLCFSNARRANETVHLPGVLFADLDAAPTPSIEPSIMWETSPGNRQAVWYLTEQIEDYEVWADLNRRLTYHLGADRGGWMGSKLLRVPESVNWKRRAFGRLESVKPWITNSPHYFDDILPKLASQGTPATTGEHPPVPSESLCVQTKTMLWPILNLRSRSMLYAATPVRDRSLHIVRTIHELRSSGISAHNIYILIWPRPWNKWRTDRHSPEQLWSEITRVE